MIIKYILKNKKTLIFTISTIILSTFLILFNAYVFNDNIMDLFADSVNLYVDKNDINTIKLLSEYDLKVVNNEYNIEYSIDKKIYDNDIKNRIDDNVKCEYFSTINSYNSTISKYMKVVCIIINIILFIIYYLYCKFIFNLESKNISNLNKLGYSNNEITKKLTKLYLVVQFVIIIILFSLLIVKLKITSVIIITILISSIINCIYQYALTSNMKQFFVKLLVTFMMVIYIYINLFHDLNINYYFNTLIIMSVIALLYLCEPSKENKNISIIIYIIYIVVITSIYNRNLIYKLNNNNILSNIDNINIIPFKSIMQYLFEINDNNIVYLNIFGNLVMFMVLTILLKFREMKLNLKKILLINIIVIMLIELFQLIFNCGIFDIDDFILNIIGVLIGYCLSFLFNKINIFKTKINNILFILVYCLCLFILFTLIKTFNIY